MSYTDYLNANHPEYLNTQIGPITYFNRREIFKGPHSLENFERMAKPIMSNRFFMPLSKNDALHEFAGMTVYPAMYLLRGVAEAFIEFGLVMSLIYNLPVLLYPPYLVFCVATTVIAAAIDIALGVVFAAAMFTKSAVGLVTGGLTTAVKAIAGDECFNNILAL